MQISGNLQLVADLRESAKGGLGGGILHADFIKSA